MALKTAGIMAKLYSSSSFKLQAKSATADQRELGDILKPRRVSPEMQAVVGVPVIPRTMAFQLIWNHIRENKLQDPDDKNFIVCYERLKKIFGGQDWVCTIEITSLPHFRN